MEEVNRESIRWQKVYIFVSSTFNDMHAERDYLVKRVFPELQDWCERRKLRLVDIDLRWGVTEQDATHNKNVVKVCLDRIDDCRPFFLCFLGQRRGWVPKEYEVSAETFAAFPDLRSVVGAASVTEMEILHALINPLHRSLAPDDTKPAERYEPSKYSFFYFRDPTYLDQFPADPPQLRETYTNEWIDDDAEREAQDLALKRWREVEVPASNRPFDLYEAKWDPDAATPELALPLQCSSTEPATVGRWQKQWQKAGVTVTGLNIEDDRVQTKKARDFNTRLSTGRLTRFECEGAPLSKGIIKQLQEAIANRYPHHSEVESESDLQKEIDQQEQFLFSASEGFIEREGDFAELDDYAESDSNKLFVLTAPGGMGKSTLLANWADSYRRRIEAGIEQHRDQSIHFRFIGQSDGTTTVYSLLRLLLSEIKEVAHKLDEEIPLDPIKLRNEWPAWLEAIGRRGKTIIVIDALNQLESGLTDVGWRPRQLPHNIKLIVSFKRGDPSAEELYERLNQDNHVTLSAVKPFESLDDRRRLIRAYLSQYLKELDAAHLETLINLRGAENPLYLKVVLSELRVFGAYSNLAAEIHSDFGDTPISAFVRVLERLENDPAYSPIDPKRAVPLLFALLAHARRGLSVEELTSHLIQALALDETEEWKEAAADTVNLFLRQVRSFLARREGRYDFFFESFKVAAQKCYVAKEREETISKRSYQEWHGLLAKYFKSLPTWQEAAPLSEAQPARQPKSRKVAELPHHMIQAEQWEGLEETLCDLDFIEAKCTAGMTYDLVTDCRLGLAAARREEQDRGRGRLNEFSRFVQGQAHILSMHPDLTFQQASNQPDKSAVAAAARKRWKTGDESRHWLQWVNKPGQLDPCLMTLAGHSGIVSSCAYSPDGKRIVSGSEDHTIKVWDVETGASILTLAGHSSDVTFCAYSPDGKHIVSVSRDGTIKNWDASTGVETATWNATLVNSCACSPDGTRIVIGSGGGVHKISGPQDRTLIIWNLVTATETAILAGHSYGVTACAYSPDNSRIVSGSFDGTIKIWCAWTGDEIATLAGHSKWVVACEYSRDGRRIVSASVDQTLKLWDAETGEEVSTFAAPSVEACAYSPDGKHIVSGSRDGALNVWDAEACAEILTLVGHSGYVRRCAYSPDGKRIVSASTDQTLKVWDAETSAEMTPSAAHSGVVTSCAYSPDGKRIISGSQDCTLKMWDAETGAELATLAGHSPLVDSGWVEGCAYLPDGKRIVSRSTRTLRIWDAQTTAEIATCKGRLGEISSCAYSPDSARIVIGSGEAVHIVGEPEARTLTVWDAETGSEIVALPGHRGGVTACAYSPDGSSIVSASTDRTLKIWDARTNTEIVTVTGHSDIVEACAYSPDSRRIVSGSFDCTLKIWDAETGAEILTLVGHSRYVRCCAYSPDGRRIVSASDDSKLKVWDAETGREIATLSGHSDEVTLCVYSPDSKRIISASRDRSLKVWDAETGSEANCFVAEGGISATAISPGGQSIAMVGGGIRMVYVIRPMPREPVIPLVTLVHLYHFADKTWGSRPTAKCEWCGQRFSPSQTTINAIQRLNKDAALSDTRPHRRELLVRLFRRRKSTVRRSSSLNPCAALPEEVWNDPRLFSQCPHCHQMLRFNPFIVDNRNRL